MPFSRFKKHQFLLALVFIFALHHSSAQKFEDARSYIMFIDSHNGKIVSQTWNYMEIYTNSNDQIAIKRQRKKLENILKSSLRKIDKADEFDKELHIAAINYLEGNLIIIKNQLVQLINFKNKKEVSVDQIALMQKIRKAIVKLRKDYNIAVENYGKRYDLKLTANDSQLAIKMENTIAVYDYYHEIKIEFNKLQIVENNLWNQINEKSYTTLISDIKDARQHLLTEKTINKLGKFKGDNSLIELLKLMNAHIEDALNSQLKPILIMKKEQETGNRDQIMIKTKNYNAALQWSNQNRKSVYEKWNKIYPIFLRKHINII